MIPYLLAVVGGYFIGSSMKDEETSKFDKGGGIKQEWVAIFQRNKGMGNEQKVIQSFGNTKEEATRDAMMSRIHHGITNDWELVNIYTYSGNLPMMANGGYLKKYNVFGKVKVLVHDYADETEYETTDFSIDVMALNEQEAMVMVEEQLMDEYLLNDYGTSMLGYKVHYTGEVDIEDVVEIKE
jgi:hypothetical protein